MMILAFDTTAVLVALLAGGSLAALFVYLGLRWTSSGRVRSTNADTLWNHEERRMTALERDNQRLRFDFAKTTTDVFDLRVKLIDVGEKAAKGVRDAGRWKRRLTECEDQIRALTAENARLSRHGGS